MNEKELLQAISKMLDEKLGLVNNEINTMHNEIDTMNQRIDTIVSQLDNIKKTMVTKADLRESENMILNELDTVQEKTNQKFNNLKLKVM